MSWQSHDELSDWVKSFEGSIVERGLLRVASWRWVRGSPCKLREEEPAVAASLQEVFGPTSPISFGILLVGVAALLGGLGRLFRGIDHLVDAQEKLRARKE
jgi:hypothetical protein